MATPTLAEDLKKLLDYSFSDECKHYREQMAEQDIHLTDEEAGQHALIGTTGHIFESIARLYKEEERKEQQVAVPFNRFKQAVLIQKGACNIRAIARVLVKAADAAAEGGEGTQEKDAAVRLIIHQLAFLACASELDTENIVWYRLIKECEEKGGETL